MSSSRLLGLIAAASVLAACSGQNSGVVGQPNTPSNSLMRHSSHALVAPGHAGQAAIMPGAPRLAGSVVHHDFTATTPCTYLTDNLSGDVKLYNHNRTLAGDFGSTTYGWGALATHSGTNPGLVYLGRNDGSGSADIYSPCTNSLVGSITGVGDGGAAYSLAGFKGPGHHGYASDFGGSYQIQYWATGTGTATLLADTNDSIVYFLDVDKHNKVWAVGYNAVTGDETADRCSATVTGCTTMIDIPGGFPGGIQLDSHDQAVLNNQFGVLTSYDCSSLSSCTLTGSFTYNNGTNPLDYTAIALDPLSKHVVWGANIYLCTDGCSFGIGSDAQPQSLPLSSSSLLAATPAWDNSETLGVARFRPDTP